MERQLVTPARIPGLRSAALRPLPWLGAVAALLLFAVLKLYSVHYTAGDENMYFYMAARAAEGALPYRDYTYAHPPLQLLPAVAVFWLVGGFHLAAAKLIPASATAVAGLLLYRSSRRRGPAQGVMACALFLLCYGLLGSSSHFVGASLAAMWVAVGLERVSLGRDRTAATAFALGTLTAVYAAPSGMGAALALLVADRRRALRFVATGLLVFGAINLCCFAVFGATFLDHVYLHHLAGVPARLMEQNAFAHALRAVFLDNTTLLWGALVGVTALALQLEDTLDAAAPRREGSRPPGSPGTVGEAWRRFTQERFDLLLLLCAALANLVFLASRSRIMHYYFTPLFVCAAPLAAYGLASIGLRALRGLRHGDRRALVGAAMLLLLLSLGEVLHRRMAGALLGSRGESGVVRHSWQGSGVAWLDRALRPLLWRDEQIGGQSALPLTRYLWHESQWFQSAEPLAEEVRRRTAASDTIFGDSASAPLIALLAGRRLALDEADTNVMGFLNRPERGPELIRRLEQVPPQLLLVDGDGGIYSMRFFSKWAAAHYTIALERSDPVFGPYLLLTRKPAPGGASAPAGPGRKLAPLEAGGV